MFEMETNRLLPLMNNGLLVIVLVGLKFFQCFIKQVCISKAWIWPTVAVSGIVGLPTFNIEKYYAVIAVAILFLNELLEYVQ